ncbi:MAG: phosphoenolpyruvate carboxykinase [Bacillota bacterium]|nr:phosphoenolpyruvate carboxykinase [Bacillota bacterium]
MAINGDGVISAEIKQGHVVLIGGTTPCNTPEEVLDSDVFLRVLWRYLRKLDKYDNPLLVCVKDFQFNKDKNGHIKERYDLEGIRDLIRAIHTYGADQAAQQEKYTHALSDRVLFADFVEEFYNFWRRQERFLIYHEEEELSKSIQERNLDFVGINKQLKALVLTVYRSIKATVAGRAEKVYRQLPAGASAGLLVEQIAWDIPKKVYEQLACIPFLQLAVIEPPLVYYPKRNKRTGQFEKLDHNPIVEGMVKDNNEFYCFPAKVGDLLIFVYFHIDFISLAVSMVNLFDIASKEEIVGKKPDCILVFGVEQEFLGDEQTVYYQDEESNIVVGIIARSQEVDYFGYFKKMVLTLHNTVMIDRGYMPIHGAMAHIQLRSGKDFSVVLVGDSGAGKSESLEAFRVLADEYMRRMTIIFDDMGSLRMKNEKVNGYGTEIGAFVRLDDLEPGYAYEEIDRSIFMSPHRTNARLVVPITPYSEIVKGYPVDLFLYANNYETVEDGSDGYLDFFATPEDAFDVFKKGERISKGTTDEKGLVGTYFSNPFGAPQKEEQHDEIARNFIEHMFNSGVKVGQLRTQLGIEGEEMTGPEKAAKALFEYVNEK